MWEKLFQSTHSIRSATYDFCNYLISVGRFQSTHSIRSATPRQSVARLPLHISIHALHTECDLTVLFSTALIIDFNPRTPYGVRPADPLSSAYPTSISIHALHTECDAQISAPYLIMYKFQSTHSIRSATIERCNPHVHFSISIHALHTECDYSTQTPADASG